LTANEQRKRKAARKRISKMVDDFMERQIIKMQRAIKEEKEYQSLDENMVEDFHSLSFDKEVFRELFPNLARELEEDVYSVELHGVRGKTVDETPIDELRYPDVISFIRRAETEEQALEVIDFMERRGEISREYANKLREQLRTKGLRSFGPKKEPGYYFKRYYKKTSQETT